MGLLVRFGPSGPGLGSPERWETPGRAWVGFDRGCLDVDINMGPVNRAWTGQRAKGYLDTPTCIKI